MEKEKISEKEESVFKQALADRGYALCTLVGKGTFSCVYRVERVRDRRSFACKVTAADRAAAGEAAILQKADHPLFAAYEECFVQEERQYLVMEYVSGNSLEEHLRRRGSFSVREAVRIALELAEGLRYLHEMTEMVIYRDLKPSNIMLREDGSVKLIDLGCASPAQTVDLSRAGTPGYSAPEQFDSDGQVSCASDVYALGKVLGQMLTGESPYTQGLLSTGEYYCRRSYEGLLQLVTVCTRSEPSQRIPDMRWMKQELLPYLGTAFQRYVFQMRRRLGLNAAPVYFPKKNIWKSY